MLTGREVVNDSVYQEIVVDPNEVIDNIIDAIDYAELAKDVQGLVKARRLLNNDLRQAIDGYVQAEMARLRTQPAR